MSLQKLAVNFAEYSYWANQKFVDWLSPKSDELLHKELPSSYSSIIKTLNHIWGTDEYWYSVLAETTDFEKRFSVEKLEHVEVFYGLLNRSKLLVELVQSFSEAELEKQLKVVSPWFESDLP